MLGVDQKIADLYLKATGDDFRVTAAAARKYNLVTKIEPVSDYVKPGHYMAAFLRPNKRANAALASLARTIGNSSAPFVSLRIKGEIGKASGIRAANVRKQLATSLHANTILAHFDSVGGSVADAFDMAAAIMEHPAQTKKAIINGQCLSAAVIPLLAFDLRVANQNAEIMIYRTEVVPTARADKRWTASELAEAASTAEMADAEILDFITSRTGFDRKFFAREMKTEKPMRLGDALKAGLIHEIAGKTG